MSPTKRRLPSRKRSRLASFDYSDPGPYFITVCTYRHRILLGHIEENTMYPSQAGELVNQVWQSLPGQFLQLDLDTFQVMPNHFHAILEIRHLPNLPKVILGQIVGAFKSEVTRHYCELVRRHGWPRFRKAFWQRGSYDHVIRNDRAYQRIANYIHDNPVRWQFDRLNPEQFSQVRAGTRTGPYAPTPPSVVGATLVVARHPALAS